VNTIEKIETLGTAAKYDICASTSCQEGAVRKSQKGSSRIGNLQGGGICHSFTPDGRCVSLFKVLMTNQCMGDCKYCLNSCEMKTKRASFETGELEKTFLSLYHRNYVEGLFLSSAVKTSADNTEENMLEVVENLRNKHNFEGYVHLKIMPGVDRDLVKRASQVANRISLNLEAPNRLRFQEITSTKDFKIDLLRRMRWAQKSLDHGMSSGQTTQFVVGASEETDHELLHSTNSLYKKLDLKRTYFSAFLPVPGTGLESSPRTPLLREHRLYQCDFLMRKYNFDFDSIMFKEDECLDLTLYPKMAMVLNNRDRFPMEINDASYQDLLMVPGIGPNSACKISKLTEQGFKFKAFKELKNMGIVLKRAKSFISINGKRQTNLNDFRHVLAT